MSRAIVVSVSVGTGLLIVCMVVMLCIAIGATVCMHGSEPSVAPAVFRPRSGQIGDAERSINELKYGPVNLDAAKEVKNGMFARIRENRQSRNCASVQRQVCVPVQQQVVTRVQQQVCVPFQTTRVIDPTDCTYSYAIAQPQPYVIQATGIESPSTPTREYPVVNPLESETGNCPTCRPHVEVEKLLRTKGSPRSENKTGSFICSHCKKPHVGEEWHTDWSEDGTPVTFLCESRYSRMSSQQRIAVYQDYAARQTLKNGKTALLHQEIGE